MKSRIRRLVILIIDKEISIQHKYKIFLKKIFASKKERIMDFKFKKFET